jgi:phosphoribosylanthranilate isomerase
MKIKVCGMKYPDNIQELGKLPVDYMGMIFYEKSSRYIGNPEQEDISDLFRNGIKRVGVFVNAGMDYIQQMTDKYKLDLIQLHGNESPEFCDKFNKIMPIIKSFSVAEPADFEKTKAYEGIRGYFLFDTKTSQYGGSGKKFDWNILDAYTGDIPFFLSGGIAVDDVGKIKKIRHPQLYSVDLNSKFETEPGLKDIELLKQFIKRLKDE